MSEVPSTPVSEPNLRTYEEWNTSGDLPFFVLDPTGFDVEAVDFATYRYTLEEFVDCAMRSEIFSGDE